MFLIYFLFLQGRRLNQSRRWTSLCIEVRYLSVAKHYKRLKLTRNAVAIWPVTGQLVFKWPAVLLLVFSVTPFKIDQNKNQNRSTDEVENLRNERRYMYKDPRQESGQRNISYTRYPNSVLPKLIEICMETPCWTMLVLDELQYGGRKPTETSNIKT